MLWIVVSSLFSCVWTGLVKWGWKKLKYLVLVKCHSFGLWFEKNEIDGNYQSCVLCCWLILKEIILLHGVCLGCPVQFWACYPLMLLSYEHKRWWVSINFVMAFYLDALPSVAYCVVKALWWTN